VSRRIKTRSADSTRVLRFAGIAGACAATAICVSFACLVVGGSVRPVVSPDAPSIVVAFEAHPQPAPLPKPLPHRGSETVRGRLVATTTARHQARVGSVTSTSPSAAKSIPTIRVTSAAVAATRTTATLLRATSKSSRTRGQPGQ
jgi:hypothetical protein